MNFLAHLWLAERCGAELAGALLGDVVRGRDLSAYPEALRQSIRLHRRIDARTDAHPLVVAARGDFTPGARRYAGIVLDVLFDHALALDWNDHAGVALPEFAQRAARTVAQAAPWFGAAGARAPQAGPLAALLLSYAEPAGIDQALARIARRSRTPERLLAAAADWSRRMPALRRDLPVLLHDLLREAPG